MVEFLVLDLEVKKYHQKDAFLWTNIIFWEIYCKRCIRIR